MHRVAACVALSLLFGAVAVSSAAAAPPVVPASATAGSPRADDEPVITDHFRRIGRTFDVGNVVADGVSVPSVRMCYRGKPCETILLPVPADAPGGARVESVTGPTAATATASGVTYSSRGASPTVWHVDASHLPLNRWVVDTATLTDRFGVGLDAVAVTGVSTTEQWFVLRRTTGGTRGADRLVQRVGGNLVEASPLRCSAKQGQTWNDVATFRLDHLALLGHCGPAAVRTSKVFVRKADGFHDLTGDLPAGVAWTTLTDMEPRRFSKAALEVTGKPVDGGATVTYLLRRGAWYLVPDPTA